MRRGMRSARYARKSAECGIHILLIPLRPSISRSKAMTYITRGCVYHRSTRTSVEITRDRCIAINQFWTRECVEIVRRNIIAAKRHQNIQVSHEKQEFISTSNKTRIISLR